jgi:hypothetical protein
MTPKPSLTFTGSMRTSKCEGCGCDWNNPCVLDVAGQPLPKDEIQKILAGEAIATRGCHWDTRYWEAKRAACSVCVEAGKVAPI